MRAFLVVILIAVVSEEFGPLAPADVVSVVFLIALVAFFVMLWVTGVVLERLLYNLVPPPDEFDDYFRHPFTILVLVSSIILTVVATAWVAPWLLAVTGISALALWIGVGTAIGAVVALHLVTSDV